MSRGKMIVLEGQDGSGKTTQVKNIVEHLKSNGFDVVTFREPGATQVGEMVRGILLNTALETDMDRLTELFLFTASRVENIKRNILPALEAGKVVICDRFVDSTMAFQGYGRGLIKEVSLVREIIDSLVKVDHTLYLTLSVAESFRRINERDDGGGNRLDKLNADMKSKINKGYEEICLQNPNGVVIGADEELNLVTGRIINWLDRVFIPANQDLKK